jgi:hypothetical protein
MLTYTAVSSEQVLSRGISGRMLVRFSCFQKCRRNARLLRERGFDRILLPYSGEFSNRFA